MASQLTLLTGMPNGKPIFGIACLQDFLFILRRRTADVEVHDAVNFNFVRRIAVPGLRNPLDMASCPLASRLYIVDGLDPSGKVYRVETPCVNQAPHEVASWSVDDVAMNVSTTMVGNVLVTCGKAMALKEFDGDGRLIRQVRLHADFVSPQHAVGLPGDADRFVVCHGWMDDRLHRVCIVDGRPETVDSTPDAIFGEQRGSRADGRLLHNPSHLVVDSRGAVYVADMGNKRVVALDARLEPLRNGRIVDVKQLPSRLCLDESRDRLYVAHNEWKELFWMSGGVTAFSVKGVAVGGWGYADDDDGQTERL